MKAKRNLLEVRYGIVHADSDDNDDHTLCGVDAEHTIDDEKDYDPKDDMSEYEHVMAWTNKKINCSKCASIIRYCVKLGLKSLDKDIKDGAPMADIDF